MFYPDKIKNIKEKDRVLEIGPGNKPFLRSNVLLELEYKSNEDRIKQFGHDQVLQTNKQIVYYNGTKFPFEDNSFDYVICSHVLEHVDDVELFLKEIFRVAKRGYFEYPLLPYDYLYNIEAHLNFLKFDGHKMYLMKKNKTDLNYFKPVHDFFLSTLKAGYGDFLTKIDYCFFEGFEWDTPFELKYSNNLNDFIEIKVKPKLVEVIPHPSIITSVKILLVAIRNKIF
jgi:ubiquinone/menaquinone biosynthesis C-methylase UbiE